MAPPDLFSPLVFRNRVAARNRLVLAPMTNLQSHPDGTLAEAELVWLEHRARGGFGVLETCAAHVAKDGQGWPGGLAGIFDDALLPGLTRLADALHRAGTLALVQIFHGGARCEREIIGGTPWSASEIPGDPGAPRAATPEDIETVIGRFRDAAVRAQRAGFDGVEVHGAHGYLLCQFLSRTQNRRTDAWGGSFENRSRLLREVTRAIRGAVPASFVVGVRISPEDFGNAKGLDLDESLLLARGLADDGIDFLHASLWDCAGKTGKRPTESPVPLFRAALPADVPLLVAGKIWTRAEAEAALALGADAVALGRAAIANPDWPLRIAKPGWEPKRPPLTGSELLARGLSPGFVDYMRKWKGFVAEG